MPAIIGIKDGSFDASLSLKKKDKIYIPVRTFSVAYFILSDDTFQDELVISATAGLPSLWSVLNGAICMDKTFKEQTTVIHPVTGFKAILWVVTCKFTTDIDPNQDQDPESKPPTVRWSGETEEEVLEKDPITLAAITTEADEPYFASAPIVLPILEISRYEFWPFDPDVMLAYSHHTNSAAFWGAPVGSALMMPMDVDEEIIEQVKYVKVTYRIKFKIKKEGATMLENTWNLRLLHHGFRYRKVAGEEPLTKTDEKENPMTINLKTEALHVGEGGMELTTGNPGEYLEFNRFPKVNFNTLSLGPFS